MLFPENYVTFLFIKIVLYFFLLITNARIDQSLSVKKSMVILSFITRIKVDRIGPTAN